jgi:DNA repair exonuclease SbcCD ATPase subunit
MIILKHLTVERFRLLREVNLHFPQRGSILIEGPNESGKSALLESVYFALYGVPLTTERGKRSLDDLIMYRATQATVTLTLLVSTTELTITRSIERGKGQKISFSVHKLGMPEEGPITRLATANERILTELGRMDGETLRNSCLLEQKGLERLETLAGSEREATVRKLLGLEKLTRMTEHFKVTTHDDRQLHEATERFHLAEIQTHIPQLSQQLEHLEEALDAVTVAENLEEIQQQEAEIVEQKKELEQVASRRLELKNRQGRVQQLKKADATIGEIIEAYDAIAEARRELPVLEKEIADLERREREELPVQEKRVQELVELTKSFGTLQRMSSDLLATVDAVKELEQDIKQQKALASDLEGMQEQIISAQAQVEQAQKALGGLDERRRSERPALEARLARMKVLSERLTALRQLEEQYSQHQTSKTHADENREQLKKVQKDLRETEQELKLVEDEAKQVQQQAEALETRWRQLSIRRQIEEWQRLKSMVQGLTEAEQHVRMAHIEQEKLTMATLEARRASRIYMLIVAVCSVFLLVCLIVAAVEAFQHSYLIATLAGLLFLLLGAGAGLSLRNFSKAHREEQVADRQMQEAMNRVSMMVAAREAAVRMGGNQEMLFSVERELQALGSIIPRSLNEAQSLLQQVPDNSESLSDIQQQIRKKRDEANAARNQVNVTMEAVVALRKEHVRLEDLRQREGWEDSERALRKDQTTLEHLHQEITLLAGQEDLPLPSINERLQHTSTPLYSTYTTIPMASASQSSNEISAGVPDLEALIESTLQATEQELAALDDKPDVVNGLAARVKSSQETLNTLLARKRDLDERNARYQTQNPVDMLQRTREQQAGLRSALQTLQESLRQHVKTLGIGFGQSAIMSAEGAARKRLEELQVTLGNKITLQSQHARYTLVLKERQESLSEHYKQLAKFSNSLGGWIVPPNPFADTLSALRTRCQREIDEADETGILKGLDALQIQEGALKARVELCRQEIDEAQECIAGLLIQRTRPTPKSYTCADIAAVWPLLSDYSVEDRSRLAAERAATEQALQNREQEEQVLSAQLQTGGVILDLEQTRIRMEQQERSYQTKKRGNQMVKAVNERLMRKMLPRTEYYIQQILPLLTGGRYHDVRLTTEEEEGTSSGGPFRLRVWETAANEYLPKTALSGGAADQLSLALRLAFAIAILPRELSAAPGFLMLDEPLSSFDRERTKSLVDVITGASIARNFEQVMLISHSSAFDAAMFPYHVYLENGVVVESNLPVVQATQALLQEPVQIEERKEQPINNEDYNDEMATLHIAAVSLPAGRNK